jgi:hypothetical protein
MLVKAIFKMLVKALLKKIVLLISIILYLKST